MTALFGYKTIAILAEDNPWLVESSRRHDVICELYNQLNGQIDSEQVPSDAGPKEVQRYNDYEQKVNELQEMMLEWDAEAKHFLQYPNLSYSSLGKFDDDQRREMKDHVAGVVSMLREDLARSRMVLTHNYEGVINDAAKAVNLKKVQESIDKANVANELAMESNKISERSLEQSGSSHRVAWAGVWLALGGIVLTLYFSLWRSTDVEDDTSSIMYEIVDDSTALLITTVGDSMLAEDGTALSDDAWPDTLNDSTRLH